MATYGSLTVYNTFHRRVNDPASAALHKKEWPLAEKVSALSRYSNETARYEVIEVEQDTDVEGAAEDADDEDVNKEGNLTPELRDKPESKC